MFLSLEDTLVALTEQSSVAEIVDLATGTNSLFKHKFYCFYPKFLCFFISLLSSDAFASFYSIPFSGLYRLSRDYQHHCDWARLCEVGALLQPAAPSTVLNR